MDKIAILFCQGVIALAIGLTVYSVRHDWSPHWIKSGVVNQSNDQTAPSPRVMSIPM